MKKFALVTLIGLFLLALPIHGAIDLVHQFAPSNIQGFHPFGDLVSDGTYFYGMTNGLGPYNGGTIFRINSDGSGLLILHAFPGFGAGGRRPIGSLLLSGTTLYGMTMFGGDASENGTIFKIETAGTGFTVLHEFVGGADDGALPYYGTLIISGSTLYGMTSEGGDSNNGTIFKIGISGSGFSLLHEFAGGADDGSYPYGSLIISGSTLYGMTYRGGDSDVGTVFKIETNGSGFSLLREFAGGADDGGWACGSLILSGTTLYGMTEGGGDNDYGTIFKIEIDGSGFSLLHEFDYNDGAWPQGSLLLSGTTLYGMTYYGGDSGSGTIFKIGTAGTGFTLLHGFARGADDGANPYGSLIISDSTLYGMTYYGGDSDFGTIFKIGTAGSGFSLLHEFAGVSGSEGSFLRSTPVLSGTTLYGMTSAGGGIDRGTLFKVETNGSGYTLLHEFVGGAADGAIPYYGSLVLSGTTLYGMTLYGGDSNFGTIFKIETNGSGFTLLHEFVGGADDGRNPYGSLLLSGTTLYGMTYRGGDSNFGTIFKIEIDGNGFTLLHEFAGGAADGANPYGSLIISSTTLYGMTFRGGDSNFGTIFKMGTAGSGFTLLHEFAGGAADGANPYGSLIISDSILYGMTSKGGDSDKGTVFKIGTTGSDFTLLHEFSLGAADGSVPYGNLLISDTTLFGMTSQGPGSDIYGTIFKIGTDGAGFSLLHEFAGVAANGRYPFGSPIISGNTLFGTTQSGGSSSGGIVFSLTLPSSISVVSPNGGEIWAVGSGQSITWTSTGAVGNVNIDYSTDSGGDWTPVVAGTANDGIYSWTVPSTPSTTCLVRIRDAADNDPSDTSDAVFIITVSAIETVSAPTTPTGPTTGTISTSYDFSTGGATSSLGHALQYKFDWDDGSDSGWLAAGTTQAAHSWAAAGTYDVRAMARCAEHTTVESIWSTTLSVIIADGVTAGHYNSPAQYKVLPEVIWSSATGGGTWMSNVQVTDVSGGSQV
ncbi:MAG: hypothetical protein L6428_06610, partial [Candidatus Aminicenantes bacterium]|nr:hypothetical protein [Candidatus Aminicenantes bacterium]